MATSPRWRPTNAPFARRTDDIWFIDPQVGWAVNSNGHILHTTDGGDSWTRQHAVNAYLRCVGFADPQSGWVGTLTPSRRLFHTTNGGADWTQVTNLPHNAPARICGLSVVNSRVVYAAGTNEPTDAPRMMRTTDGGQSWTAWEMRPYASILIDTLFLDELRGWVVGGRADDPDPQTRDQMKPVVLFTTDGGKTWVNRLAGQEADFPFGEWGWKMQFLNNQEIGFVSLENFDNAAILKTRDGGLTWTRLPVRDSQGNTNLEGIGFLDELQGWVGGWGDRDGVTGRSSGTSDGGSTWSDANEIGRFLNRFRFFGQPITVGYASGGTIYKYTAGPVPATTLAARPVPVLLPQSQVDVRTLPAVVPFVVPARTVRLTLDVWTRFGRHIGTLLDEIHPAAGARTFLWDGRDANGHGCGAGPYIVRMTADAEAESALLVLQPRRTSQMSTVRWTRHRLRLPPSSPLRVLALAGSSDTHVDIELPDLSGLDTPLKKARFLLDTAAEVEHALLVQYLYAAYSLKKPAEVADAQQQKALRAWKPLLTGIAKEEMGHLMTVQNLLRLLGQPPNFEREDLPAPPGLYPFKMQLEPLTQSSLAKYVVAESPVDATGIDDIVHQATQGARMPLNHVGTLYALLGVVFTRQGALVANATSGDPWYMVLRDIGTLALEQEPGPQRWHLPDDAFDSTSVSDQMTDAEWSPGGELRVFVAADRQAALDALRDIALQGEGPVAPTNDPSGSHFQRFFAIYRGTDTVPAFPSATGAWEPAHNVPTNPVLGGDTSVPNAISEAKATDFARLSDLRYALLLGFLEQCYLVAPGLRRLLIGWCFNEMRRLQMLADILTGLPRATGQPGVAALPFTLPADLHLPAQPASQWQIHIDRLNAALALAQQMLNSHSAGNQMLINLQQDDQQKLLQAQAAQQGTLPIPTLGRWEQVRSILDAATGFGNPSHGGEKRFWHVPLAEFLTKDILGQPLIAPPGPDRGKNSNLIKALKGEAPFDGSDFQRMPLRRPPVSSNHIAFIEAWIDADCPEL